MHWIKKSHETFWHKRVQYLRSIWGISALCAFFVPFIWPSEIMSYSTSFFTDECFLTLMITFPMPAAHVPVSMATPMFAIHMPTSYNLSMSGHMTFMMTCFMTALQRKVLSVTVPVSNPMSASFVFPLTMLMGCVPVPMLRIYMKRFVLTSFRTYGSDRNGIMISMAFSEAKRTDQLPVCSTIDLQRDVVAETEIRSRLPVNDYDDVVLAMVSFLMPKCMSLMVRLDTLQAESDSLLFTFSAGAALRVCRSRVARRGILQSCLFQLLYHLSKHCVLVKSRPLCESLSALGTAVDLWVFILIPVILNARHAVVMSTRNSYWIKKRIQTDRTAERVLVLERSLSHFTLISIRFTLSILILSVQVFVKEQNKETSLLFFFFIFWVCMCCMKVGMPKTHKEVWCIRPAVVSPVIQVFETSESYKCKLQIKVNRIVQFYHGIAQKEIWHWNGNTFLTRLCSSTALSYTLIKKQHFTRRNKMLICAMIRKGEERYLEQCTYKINWWSMQPELGGKNKNLKSV